MTPAGLPRLFRRVLVASLALLPTVGGAAARQRPPAPDSLQAAIDGILDDPAFASGFWGVVVVDASDGNVLYARNAGKRFMPASNAKLYTTAAALDQLGPRYRYVTHLYAQGPVVDGVLRGNLIVRGRGDPTFGGHYDPLTGERRDSIDVTTIFQDWADSLRAAGIQTVDGDLVGDDDVFDDEALGAGWAWDDETFWYSAELGGLAFADNTVELTVRGRMPGRPARITWEPYQTSFVQVFNASRTVRASASYEEHYQRARGTNVIRVGSILPAGRTDTEAITVHNPTLYFVHVLRETLLRAGIAVTGMPVDVDDLSIKPHYQAPDVRPLATHASPPLSTIITMTNKASQNLYADQLLKTLGVERPVFGDDELTPGSAAMGLAAETRTLVRAGVDTSAVALVDGSGLSRYNLVTPQATAALLAYVWHHPNAAVRDAFVQSLPRGGVDGTLKERFTTSPAIGMVRAKTGTLTNVSSLSGYVSTAAGRTIIFVTMCNHYATPTRRIRNAQDRIVMLLAAYEAGR